jgi:hypothetical protein
VLQQTSSYRIAFDAFSRADDSGQQSHDALNYSHCSYFSATQDEVANAYLIGGKVLAHALIHALIPSAYEE